MSQLSYFAATVAVLVLLPLSLTACGGDSAGPETDAAVQDVTADENVFTGEDSLLVLAEKGTADVQKGETAHVTGTVERFTFADYADIYGLDDERDFEPYHDTQILVAENIHLSTPEAG